MSDASEKNLYLLQRERNIRAIRESLGFDFNPNAIASEVKEKPQSGIVEVVPVPKRKTKRSSDPSYSSRVLCDPGQRRQSLRIAKLDISVHYDDGPLEMDSPIKRVEKIHKEEVKPVIINGYRAKHFTEQELANVAQHSSMKIYDSINGTTCHQCRQKTNDTKTYCHNASCKGVFGQFCGPCLSSRYGEKATDALRDIKWICPYCRRICNCSFCLRKRGIPPTGIMAPQVQNKGFKSVHHYLTNSSDDSNEECETDKENRNQNMEKPNPHKEQKEYTLGFTRTECVVTHDPTTSEKIYIKSKFSKKLGVCKNQRS